jgi:hypothetical protein
MVQKADAKQSGVLGSLPATRPERLGRPRGETPASAPPPAPKAAPAKRKPAARKPAARARKPAPVSAAAPALERLPRMTEMPPARPLGPPRGTELVTTAIQAAGELTQIGLTLGGQVLKRAVDRIPRP